MNEKKILTVQCEQGKIDYITLNDVLQVRVLAYKDVNNEKTVIGHIVHNLGQQNQGFNTYSVLIQEISDLRKHLTLAKRVIESQKALIAALQGALNYLGKITRNLNFSNN